MNMTRRLAEGFTVYLYHSVFFHFDVNLGELADLSAMCQVRSNVAHVNDTADPEDFNDPIVDCRLDLIFVSCELW